MLGTGRSQGGREGGRSGGTEELLHICQVCSTSSELLCGSVGVWECGSVGGRRGEGGTYLIRVVEESVGVGVLPWSWMKGVSPTTALSCWIFVMSIRVI